MRLTDSEVCTLLNALGAAADVYDTDASAADAHTPRIADQFRRQAREARQLRAHLEAAASVEVTP